MINNGNLKLAQQISVFPPKKQLFSCLIVTKCPFEVLSRNPAMLTQSMGTFSTGIVAIILLLPFEYSLCLLLVCPTGEQTVSGLAAPYNNRSHLVVIDRPCLHKQKDSVSAEEQKSSCYSLSLYDTCNVYVFSRDSKSNGSNRSNSEDHNFLRQTMT